MIETFIGLSVATAAGFAAGWYCGVKSCRDEHNNRVRRLGERSEEIIRHNAAEHQRNLDVLKARVESIARQCGVEIPADAEAKP